jgi:hypothetical protein
MTKDSMRPKDDVLKQNSIFVKNDSEFAAYARLMQNIWRINTKNNFPIGTYKQQYIDLNGKRAYRIVNLGNLIEKEFAIKTGANFLTENIKSVVVNSLKHKEKGATIERNRLYSNLLSSQPLAFNLFGEMALDNNLATKLFVKLFPDRIKTVTKIIFEHSDGRADSEYTGDRSAFDVFVEYITINDKNGFIGIEVKYSENLKDSPSSHKNEYERITIDSGLFKSNSLEYLKKKPIQQIWRDHLLSIAHLKHKNKKYDDGFFLYLFPSMNIECQNGVVEYKKHLVSADEKLTGFYTRHLEKFIDTLSEIDDSVWIKEFRKRYLSE